MQGGVIGGICLLAFLLSVGRAEDLERVKASEDRIDTENTKINKVTENSNESMYLEAPDDLKNEISLVVTESNSQDQDERSGAIAYSSAHSYGGSSANNAVVQSNSDGSSSVYSDGFGVQAKATAITGVAPQLSSPNSPQISPQMSPQIAPQMSPQISSSLSSELAPFLSSSASLSKAEAQAISDSGGSYSQGSNSYPFASPFPYNSASSSAQPQAQPYETIYQADLGLTNMSPYSQGKPNVIATPSLTSFNQASSPVQALTDNDGASYQPIIDSLSKPSKPASRFNSAYPYNLGSPIQGKKLNEAYQPLSKPDPNLSLYYDPYKIPYGTANSAPAQTENEMFRPMPIQNLNFNQYDPYLRPYIDGYNSAPAFSSTNPYRLNSAQSETESGPYQAIPIPDPSPAPYDASLVPYRGSKRTQAESEPIALPSYPYNSIKIGGNKLDEVEKKTKNSWDSYAYNIFPPSASSLQPYASGGDGAQSYSDAKSLSASGASKSNRFDYGINPFYINDYPSESPYRPGSFSQSEQQWISNAYANEQSSPIAFEDAKSRLIMPREYVFPNKMPGGENIIQCTKENEFYHFWSQEVDCLVCICVNEYGLLTPVCASCGGCQNPLAKPTEVMPKLPKPVPVRPESPEPIEPLVPEPYPLFPQPSLKTEEPVPKREPIPEPYGPFQPEPVSELYNPPKPEPFPEPYGPPKPEPLPEPYSPLRPEPLPESYVPLKPEPLPEPYAPYPEPFPSPSSFPETFTEPTPTLPPQPLGASCNPLPSGKPFTNPLHPCQICTCKESYSTGRPDVQIECKENPQCIAPDDVTTLPPLPDVPVAVPLPMCEKFPEHVLFPHPTDNCKLCKCSKSPSEDGEIEQQITCYPHPDCIPLRPITESETLVPPDLPIPVEPDEKKPYPEPEPMPIPVEPLRKPAPPLEPVPLPDIVTAEPLPWPPTTTTAPMSTTLSPPIPRYGPLPGPSPHESCQPYPPNQPFQHPWDECKICQCTEATAVGMITVEVNCYTKLSCCIEPPDSVKTANPGYNKPRNLPEIQVLANGQQPGITITSTYKPPAMFYSQRTNNVYPGSQSSSSDDQGYLSGMYIRPPDDGYANSPPGYTYPSNYPPGYKPPYPEYPSRLPASGGSYKSNNYGYPASYSGSQGIYQQYDPRYQSPPTSYSSLYQRPNYEMAPYDMYPPGYISNAYAQAITPKESNSKNPAQSARPIKTSNDGSTDSSDAER